MESTNATTAQAAPAPDGRSSAGSIGLDRRRPLMRVDLTINLPTIISVIGLVSAVFATGIGIYSDLDKRQMRTDLAVAEIRTRLDKTESAITNIKVDQAAQTAALRGEMKGDISEIKDMLNRLIFGGGGAPQPPRRRQLDKDWSK